MFAAIVPAAGTGDRFRAGEHSLPKQYMPLSGRPLLTWSVSTLAAHPEIATIVIPVSEAMRSYAQEMMEQQVPSALKKLQLIVGGDTRQESVRLALEFLGSKDPTPEHLLVHDAARPFLTHEMINGTIQAAITHGACTLAIPINDTVKKVQNGVITETLDRSVLFAIQTPQAGKFRWLLESHRRARAEGLSATDDASVLEFGGHQVFVVKGSPWNLKITTPEDLVTAAAVAPLLARQ